MITIAELLASSDAVNKEGQDNIMMVKSSQIPRNHLHELVSMNFIKQTMKDWYVVLDPRAIPFLNASKAKEIRCVGKVA